MPTGQLAMMPILGIAVAALVLTILGRAQAYTLRLNCGRPGARRLLIAVNVLAFVVLCLASITVSWIAFAAGAAIVAAFDYSPRPILWLTGGPDPDCRPHA
jgi:hypothetical protein